MPSFIFIIFMSLLMAPIVQAQDRCNSIIQKSCNAPEKHFPDGTGALTQNNFKSKAEEITQPVKNAIKLWITNNVSDPIAQQKMKTRVDSLTVRASANCRTGSDSAAHGARALQGGVSYSKDENLVFLCFDFFKDTPSEYSLVQALAHEMAHSIDPCQLRESVGENPRVVQLPSVALPYNIIDCLLSDDSIGFGKTVSSKNENVNIAPTPDICDGIRATEGFSDYLAIEVTDSFLKTRWSRSTLEEKENGLSNIFARHCSPKDQATVDSYKVHMNPRVRVEWLLLSNESIRRNLECKGPAPKKYCDKNYRRSSPNLDYPATEYNLGPGNH